MNKLDHLIDEIVAKKRDCIFISPHLDDAALSAGAFISHLSEKVKVEVVTVFTESGTRNSLSAKSFLKQCNYENAETLFIKRRKEDILAFNSIDVKTTHLGFKDALWREKNKMHPISRFLEKLLPEFGLIYPTYRFHMKNASISRDDEYTISAIAAKLKEIIDNSNNPLIFCPAGVGNHVDHLVTKKAVEMIAEPIYWIDQPYEYRGLNTSNNDNYYSYGTNNFEKTKLISFYKTQVAALFSHGNIPNLKEIFIIKNTLESDLPKNINHYGLIREILRDKKPKNFSYGLYSNGKQEAFAKQWFGKSKNKFYYLLQNEINVYKELHSVLHNNSSIKKQFPHISTPEYISSTETNNSLTLLIGNITTNKIHDESEEKQIGIILDIVGYLSALDKKIDKNNKEIMHRNMFFWFAISPIISILAIIRYPQSTPHIIKGFLLYIANIPTIFNFKKVGFVHRDLAQSNISMDKDHIYFYDFQLSCFTNPLIEYVIICLKQWNNKPLSRALYEQLRKTYFNDEKSLNVFRAYSALFAIYDLSLQDGGEDQTAIDFIKFILNNSNFQTQIERKINRYYKLTTIRLYFEFMVDFLYSFTISSLEKITVQKYNPKMKEIANNLIQKIKQVEPDLKTELLGSTAFEIDGQNDIDIVAECSPSEFRKYLPSLKKILGKPFKRRKNFIEWLLTVDDCSIEFCLMDPRSNKFKKRMLIYNVIKNDKKLIEEYRKLKLRLNGSSLRTYEQERQKFFFNIILNNN